MKPRTRTLLSVTLAAATLAAAGAAAASAPRLTPPVAFRRVSDAPRQLARTAQTEGQVLLPCQIPDPASGYVCYGPDQIRAAYQVQPLLDRGVTGQGRKIVIVGAYAPPTVATDLQTFDAVWGLKDPALKIVAPQGTPAYDPTDPVQQSWSAELGLDTQWAHVIAPDAKITVVEARSASPADFLAATSYAVDRAQGDVVSMSFGQPEACVDAGLEHKQHALFARAVSKGITLVAGAGDTGSAWITCDETGFAQGIASPASDPNVLSVGGTALTADGSTGAYESETAWNESAVFGLAGGGGFSSLYPKPAYQQGTVPGHRRAIPDVAYSAGVGKGVLVYLSGLGPGTESFYVVGGTSAGAPQWSGLAALADQAAGHRLGALNPALYASGVPNKRLFHDITTGDNTYVNPLGTVPGYPATKGWDPVTGLGTPIASTLIPYLAHRR